MPIDVTCPGCHKRFKVSDKFAGQKGPCPKCKTVMEIPKPEDQVVIHAPDEVSGPKDAKGRSVLKTSKFKDARFNPITAGIVGGVVVLLLIAAFMLQGQSQQNPVVLGAGALLLGPLIAWAGYPMLRDLELEAYAGVTLWLRSAICGAAFALSWGVYSYIGYQWGGEWPLTQLEPMTIAVAAVVAFFVAGLGSLASMDFEPVMAGLHAGMYFVLTILLRLVMGLDALPGLSG